MTGWQSNDGGQENWNQPSFGPDPHTNQYGTDPYANPYGADPYSTNPYSGGYDPYQQQPYPPTGGFPAQGYGPPPPKRSKLPMILSLVAIVIIVGAVVTIVLVNRQDSQPVTQNDPTTTSSTSSQKKTSPSGSSSSAGPTESGPDGWATIDNSAAGLTYQVPSDWAPKDVERRSGEEGITFSGNADYGAYECEGNPYVRAFAASGSVQGRNGTDLDLATTVQDFAKSFGTTYFGADAQVEVPAATEADVEGQTAMTATAEVTQNVTSPACQAATGEVGLVGVLLESDDEPTGVAMLVVINDLTGGPADPKPLDPSITQQVLQTVRVS